MMYEVLLSIIIPTRNRCESLCETLESLRVGCSEVEHLVECIVIDNGSEDSTEDVVTYLAHQLPFSVRCARASCPGLHVGRNLGAQEARGDILAYLDDDVIVRPGWAKAILEHFQADQNLTLLGGPCRPIWEAFPPAWVDEFKVSIEPGYYYSQLSLIDLGENEQRISGTYIFGCNFIIRKQFVLDCGGFPPDGMPKHLLKYRGSGETTISMAVDADPDAYALYDPKVEIGHRVPASRLTKSYFLSVAKRAGISSAFAQFREVRPLGKWKTVKRAIRLGLEFVTTVWRKRIFKENFKRTDVVHPLQWQSVCLGFLILHFLRLFLSPALSQWALQKHYFADDPCPYWDSKED